MLTDGVAHHRIHLSIQPSPLLFSHLEALNRLEQSMNDGWVDGWLLSSHNHCLKNDLYVPPPCRSINFCLQGNRQTIIHNESQLLSTQTSKTSQTHFDVIFLFWWQEVTVVAVLLCTVCRFCCWIWHSCSWWHRASCSTIPPVHQTHYSSRWTIHKVLSRRFHNMETIHYWDVSV